GRPPAAVRLKRDHPIDSSSDRTHQPQAHRRAMADRQGLSRVGPGRSFPASLDNDGLRETVLRDTLIHLIPEDAYAYIDDEKGHVVVGLYYLQSGEERTLYLDILHELVHIRQWHEGKKLWDRRYNYVDRPTAVEAYKF